MNDFDLEQIEKARKTALEEYSDNYPVVVSSIAGLSFSKDGTKKIIEMLDAYFSKLLDANDKMPESALDVKTDQLAEIDALSTQYLMLDNFRPGFGLAILPSKRREKFEYDDHFNKRSMYALASLNRCKSFIK